MLDGSTGAVMDTYNVGTAPHDICFDGTNIWVTSEVVTVSMITPGSEVMSTIAVGRYPSGICFDGTNIWIAISSEGAVFYHSVT